VPPVPRGPYRAHFPVDKSVIDKVDIHVFEIELHVNENIADQVTSFFMFVTHVSDIVSADINVICVWCANVAHSELWVKFIHGVLTHQIIGSHKTKELNNFGRKILADYFLNVRRG